MESVEVELGIEFREMDARKRAAAEKERERIFLHWGMFRDGDMGLGDLQVKHMCGVHTLLCAFILLYYASTFHMPHT